ncbi:ABC-type enterochelin transport system substrate-binding protein [Paenibacillus eucommiae]|uniref:ABC-type enterochelin transport system substrate-binding protein n=1 Tax=Paenibacillus eucommiae TaxID=1355755 RepID=A0ABS4IWQ8_9BACL|nr:ABC-type enterochelin transport system substrate-binding protein [Paenibacillus eucommiae]
MLARTKKSNGRLWIHFTLIAVLLLVVAGCGSAGSETQKNGVTQTPASSSNVVSSPAAGTDSNAKRTMKDAYGDVEVPANPVRIVVLDIGALDNLLELGIKPVGAPSILSPGDPYPSYLKGTDGIENIGSVNEPNLEVIDRLKPDLIIGNKDTHDGIHDQLKQIAPTVFVETLGVT